ncbi:MAG: hypothetical protein HWE22_13240 [Flavobacteriales bacterium]|nr:hypothetical protein [Flavobacteriales bacterium]
MKTLLILLGFISTFSFAQTNVIAAKSHASSEVIDPNDRDNFGNPDVSLPIRFLHSVQYLESDCIVEKSEVVGREGFVYDTICEHPFLTPGQIDVKRLKAMYPDNTEFIGFEALNKDEGNLFRRMRENRRSSKSSALWLLIIGGGLFLTYLFIPRLKVKTS